MLSITQSKQSREEDVADTARLELFQVLMSFSVGSTKQQASDQPFLHADVSLQNRRSGDHVHVQCDVNLIINQMKNIFFNADLKISRFILAGMCLNESIKE